MADTYNFSNKIDEGYDGEGQATVLSMTAFTAIALYNSVELILLILYVFKKYKGWYFWSLLITSIVIIPYQIGAWTKQMPFNIQNLVPVALLTLSWMVLIPGQSIVLWSRLHLITQHERLLRFILWMIIVNWFLFCIPTTVMTWGANIGGKHNDQYVQGYKVMGKIQMTFFTVQEVFISSVYLWEIRKTLRSVYAGSSRKIIVELAIVNIILIGLDIALLVVEYANLIKMETTMKGMIYSIKLKLEFGVLSKLVKVTTSMKRNRQAVGLADLGPGTNMARLPSNADSSKRVVVENKRNQQFFIGAHRGHGMGNDAIPEDVVKARTSDDPLDDFETHQQNVALHHRQSHQSISSELSYPGRIA